MAMTFAWKIRPGAFLGAALLALAALPCACGAASGGEAGDSAEERIKARFTVAFTLDMPVLGVQAADDDLRAFMDRQVRWGLENGADRFGAEPDESIHITVAGTASRPLPGILSVFLTTNFDNNLAAHPTQMLAVRHYDALTGEPAGLDALFAEPERALTLFRWLAPDAVIRWGQESAGEGGLAFGREDLFMEGFRLEHENYSAYTLEPGGIRLHFQQYQVLPYAWGQPEAFMPLEALAAAGPSETVWPKRDD